jgi:hypothetical protein
MLIIDAHSHIGEDYYHGIANIDDYIELMRKSGIKAGLLMSVPSPVYYSVGIVKI